MFAPRVGPYLFVALAGIAGAVAALLRVGSPWAVPVALLLGVPWSFLALFLRDPERVPGEHIVAPADGRVQLVDAEGAWLRIAVFMNVTDVHVNRFPMDATVEAVDEAGRGHVPAYRPESRGNVQREYRLRTSVGTVRVLQVTGILARRLVSFVAPGASRRKGERLGMIVLGSRVDLLLPSDRVQPLVRVGERVRAGRSSVAKERT